MPASTTNESRREKIRSKLKLKSLQERTILKEKFPDVVDLLNRNGIDLGNIRQHSTKLISTGIFAGSLFFNPHLSFDILNIADDPIKKLAHSVIDVKRPHKVLVDSLEGILPKAQRPLGRNEEKVIEQLIQQTIGIKVKATLEGEHLNTTYGYIGAEQHLTRFPGDTLPQHGNGQILNEGMAPGLGAWGYFANSKAEMSEDLEDVERWYAVVQTLYLPDWNTRQPHLKNWYKYRKVLIVNTENGNAVVASIADSGPAAWTGKHFGGSPEVMDHLGGSRYKKGPVIILFVDDPYNEIPLGPVEYGQLEAYNLVIPETS